MSNLIDPKEHYNGTAFEGLDAFERQLKRFGIEIPSSEQTSLESLCQYKIEAVVLDFREIEVPFDNDCRIVSDPPTFKSL